MKNIYAHTDPTPSSRYPAFISINVNAEGAMIVSVRTEDAQTPSEIALTHEQVKELIRRLIDWAYPVGVGE
jgi:hypothetical protein